MYKALISFNLALAEGESVSFEQGKEYNLTAEQIEKCDMSNFEKVEGATATEETTDTNKETTATTTNDEGGNSDEGSKVNEEGAGNTSENLE